MQARDQRAERDRVEVEGGRGQVDPRLDADVDVAVQRRDDVAARRAADRGRRHARCGRGFLERRPLEDPRELVAVDVARPP